MSVDSTPKRIVVCGHRSFAAKGLGTLLAARGHTVVNFSRGGVCLDGAVVTGPVDQMSDNPHLPGPYDTVINYILLKDDPVGPNLAYLEALLAFCQARSVGHLIHISSISSYKSSVSLVHEDAEIETNADRKGSYGGLKVATDQFILEHLPSDLKLTFVRPGFILAPGLLDPIIGMGFRLPKNGLLLVGSPRNCVPVTTRDVVNEAVAGAVDSEPTTPGECVLVVDSDSPTRREFLGECCRRLGCGTSVKTMPKPLWLAVGAGGETVARVAGMQIRPFRLIRAACRTQRFDSSATQRRLGITFRVDWRDALSTCIDGQEQNFDMPHKPVGLRPTRIERVAIIGFGGIVHQCHLPALKKLGFKGRIDAYDLHRRTDASGQEVRSIRDAELEPADLYVVATPGRAHIEALPLLANVRGPILVEKPLAYSKQDCERWSALERSGERSVFVCHNFRFKKNVQAMLRHLSRYNPGKLWQVDVNYQSPAVGKDSPSWRRDERTAQTLLMDYSLHYLDLAAMFCRDGWAVEHARYELNSRGETALIEGRLKSEAYAVNFMLRQGFMPRRARFLYTFQNYCVSLGFFPDTFVPHMTFDNPGLHALERKASFRATLLKVIEKVTNRSYDDSHALAIQAAMGDEGLAGSVSLGRLGSIYQAVFDLAHAVYGRELGED